MKKVLVTGGTGLLGRTLVPLLRNRYDVHHLDITRPEDGLPFLLGDLRDSKAVFDACRGCDVVIHCAALHGEAWARAGDETGFEVNVIGTKNILEASEAAGVGRVVFTSSIWATGHGSPAPTYLPIDEAFPRQPAELYGLSKLLGEQMCTYASALHGMSTIMLRPGGILTAESYGPRQTAYLGGVVDVRDAAMAHLNALEAPDSIMCEAFNITVKSPLCAVDSQDLSRDPVSTLEPMYPGFAAAAKAGELQISPQMEWYTVEKAQRLLGFHPRFNFSM